MTEFAAFQSGAFQSGAFQGYKAGGDEISDARSDVKTRVTVAVVKTRAERAVVTTTSSAQAVQ